MLFQSQQTIETLEKGVKSLKLAMKTPGRRRRQINVSRDLLKIREGCLNNFLVVIIFD